MDLPSNKRILSAAQPTGEAHIGNYLGAFKQWVALQDAGNDVCAMIADLHAITAPYDAATFPNTTLRMAALLMAVGLDPKKSVVFIQSHVPAHTEAAWLLTTITPVGDLTRMTQYKDKAKKQKTVGAGLLNYPTLMAADILLYQTEIVPVGEDQTQHLEFARTLARKFNRQFGKTFTEPRAFVLEETARIMSLTDPTRKMSKSDLPASRIGLLDDPSAIPRKIRAAVTDSGTAVNPKKLGPALTNLLTIFATFSEKPFRDVAEEYAGLGYAVVKSALADLLVDRLAPIRNRAEELLWDHGELQRILADGAERAATLANKTLVTMRKRMGLLLPQNE
ncbi:MAG: tryptophanyl-tRNA synthetase [Parcubacteria group bacterium Gr01-1014_38]|nr:MAG: tryptophanyl-tRNA synthetase [Parcubacteria group bacterium Gr01-1014_38]